jgi:hypothetical protein
VNRMLDTIENDRQGGRRAQQEQQTGMLFMQMQQQQPALHMAIMQSQQAWIMAQQSASPLVQVTQMPPSIISHLHMAIVMLQQQTIIPFIIMQQLHMPPAIMVQRCCIIVADMESSQLHVIFMPPLHFSIVMAQRGTIIICGAAGIEPVPAIGPAAIGPTPKPAIPIRSIIIAVIALSPVVCQRISGQGSSTFPR